jgi:hypothetical protein
MTNDIRSLIADDGFAMSFQSMGQYRTALLREIDNTTNQTNPLDEKELIDLVSSLWVTANSLDHFGQCYKVSPGLLYRASEFISKQDARISELAGGTKHTRTDDEILFFLGNHELIDGDLEENEDGTLRWVITEQLNRYDGDDDWEVKDATDTLLGLVRWIKEPSFLGPIPEPVPFRFHYTHHHREICIEACDRGNTKWVVRDRDHHLNRESKWELPNSLSYLEFLDKFSWPTKEEALAAYRAIPKPLTLEQRQAAEIAELRALLNHQQSTTNHQPEKP